MDNAEILFVYVTNKRLLDTYESLFENQGFEKRMQLNNKEFMTSFHLLDEEDIIEMKKDPHYLYCRAVNQKLQPIAELIRESQPELYAQVEDSFNSGTDIDIDLDSGEEQL